MSHAPALGSDGLGVSVCDVGKTFFGCGLVACLARFMDVSHCLTDRSAAPE